MESGPHKHFLKPEQEVRNYYLALLYLENKLKKKGKSYKKNDFGSSGDRGKGSF